MNDADLQTTEQEQWVLVDDDWVSDHSLIDSAKLVLVTPGKTFFRHRKALSLAQENPANVLLVAAYPGVVEALDGLLIAFHREGESRGEQFERMAEQFYRDTGVVAPGKDIPAVMDLSESSDDNRREAWAAWMDLRVDKARASLSAVHPAEGGKT